MTLQTDKNQNNFIFSVDHSDIFDHKYYIAIHEIYLAFNI